MSELILTEEERKAAWCDCDDKTLADILRHCLVVTESIKSKDQDLAGLNAACAVKGPLERKRNV